MTDVDEFLEHHGVKGQKWGVRRYEKSRAERAKQWVKKNKEPIKEAAAWTGVVVGAAVAGHILANHAGESLSSISAINARGGNSAKTEYLLRKNAVKKLSDIRNVIDTTESVRSNLPVPFR